MLVVGLRRGFRRFEELKGGKDYVCKVVWEKFVVVECCVANIGEFYDFMKF